MKKIEVDFKNALIVFSRKTKERGLLKSILSYIIRFATKSRYSHVALCVKLYGKVFVVDSDINKHQNGVSITPWDVWINRHDHITVFDPNVQDQNGSNIVRKMIELVGHTSYDVKAFSQQAKRFATGRVSKEWEDMPEELHGKRFTCSEFVAWVFSMKEFYLKTPKDIYDACSNDDQFAYGQFVYSGNPEDLTWIKI